MKYYFCYIFPISFLNLFYVYHFLNPQAANLILLLLYFPRKNFLLMFISIYSEKMG